MGQSLVAPRPKQLSMCMPESEPSLFSLNASKVGGIAFSVGNRNAPFHPVLENNTL